MYAFVFKRALDFTAALLLLVLLSPLMLLIAWRIKAEDGGPALFEHERITQGGRLFKCLKFRTMRTDANQQLAAWAQEHPQLWAEFRQNQKLKDDPRVLPLGRALRRTSLDELPQLINVLRGEMSLVGPRPVTREELARYAQHKGLAAYLSMTPGITGLWQVSGRSQTSYEERVQLDLRYHAKRSLVMDLRILIKTLKVPFSPRDAY